MISAGAGPLIARATGAGDWALRRRVLGLALRGSLITLVTMVLGSAFASQIASLLGLTGETHSEVCSVSHYAYAYLFPTGSYAAGGSSLHRNG